MSLDVYLTMPPPRLRLLRRRRPPVDRIMIRERGEVREITREEWDARHPGVEPVVFHDEDTDGSGRVVFDANITHNLGRMAKEVDLYQALWRPEEIGAKRARDLVHPLTLGIHRLVQERERLQEFNPANGWGDWVGLLTFTSKYQSACALYPNALIGVSR